MSRLHRLEPEDEVASSVNRLRRLLYLIENANRDLCPATREAVEESMESGLGPDCEICGRPADAHPDEVPDNVVSLP